MVSHCFSHFVTLSKSRSHCIYTNSNLVCMYYYLVSIYSSWVMPSGRSLNTYNNMGRNCIEGLRFRRLKPLWEKSWKVYLCVLLLWFEIVNNYTWVIVILSHHEEIFKTPNIFGVSKWLHELVIVRFLLVTKLGQSLMMATSNASFLLFPCQIRQAMKTSWAYQKKTTWH